MPPVPTSARAIVTAFLEQFGLGSLGAWAWERYLALGGEPSALSQITAEMTDRPEFAARFPAYKDLAAKGRAMSPAEMLSYETVMAGILHNAGIPSGFYDQPEDFAEFMRNEVSVAEIEQRVSLAQQAALDAPAETRQALADLYGIGTGQIVAMFLDPDRALPVIRQQYTAAALSGTATRTGYGPLSATEAERLAALGVDETQAAEGFSTLAQSQDLFDVQAGEQRTDTAIGREQQLGAAFGSDAASQRRIAKRRRERAAQFEGAAGFGLGREGVAGLGTSR